MAKTAYIAFDLGAESGRAMLGVLEDGKVSVEELHRFQNRPQSLPDGYHWNLGSLWSNVQEGLRLGYQHAKANGLPLASVGVDTWGCDHVFISKSGRLLGAPYAYRDDSHVQAMDKTLKAFGDKLLYDATGNHIMPFNTLFQFVARNEADPELLRLADRILFMPDILHYFLTGKATTEATVASTAQLIDSRTGRWAVEMLETLGLPTQMLGELIEPATPLGTLRPEVADECGVPADLQVIAPATHDTASAVAAVPADPGTRWCYISSGTWSLMGAEVPEPLINDDGRTIRFTNERGVDNTIRYLTNIGGMWPIQECRREYERKGESYDYAELTKLAEQAEPLRTLIDLDHSAFYLSGDMPEKIAAFTRNTSQPEPTDIGQLVRCCLDSLALTYRHSLINLERLLDRTFDVIHIVGGGSRNDLLNQMTADATGQTIVAGPSEATAIGNVLMQAIGCGHVKDVAEMRRIVSASFEPKTFRPGDTKVWDAAYERFTKVLGQ